MGFSMFRVLEAAITVKCGEIGICANKTHTIDQAFGNVVQLLLSMIGGLSVIFILYGGFRYVISRGDPAHIKESKEIIIYAIMGIIVAVMGFAVVGFVASRF